MNIKQIFKDICCPDDYTGYGNSFHAKGGRGTKRSQLKYCLRVIRSVVSTSNEQAIQDLTDQGALNTIIKVLKAYSVESEKPTDQIDVEIQSDLLFILSCLCENDLHRKVKINYFENNQKQKSTEIFIGTIWHRWRRNTNRIFKKEA